MSKKVLNQTQFVHDPERGHFAEWEEHRGPVTLKRMAKDFVIHLRGGPNQNIPPGLR